MKLSNLIVLLSLISTSILLAQKPTLDYYLPKTDYDENIPTPESVFGHQVGEWHLSHDKLVHYYYALAAASDRVTIQEYARTYENRPLLLLTITSTKNHRNLEVIQAEHLAISDPNRSGDLNLADMPVVIYQGFSIHGNEPSGGNAGPLVAYHLAAGKGAAMERLLENTVILLDPCYNPDGFNRFSSWVNTHKSKNLVSDSQSREFSEAWPRGRTNHYWFDLNRDWLPTQHPESQGRIRSFHDWKPNVLTDHHEMGSNSTFFFMPGIPSRTNPITPQENQDLTAAIGQYHAEALDEIGSFYYSEESFDDFYIGKGSTYPDGNGCIGILFEQGSSRGHLQETSNGVLSFPFTIRNQVRTALSTQKAAFELKSKLLDFQRRFYTSGVEDAKKGKVKAYLFAETNDKNRLAEFLDLLNRHKIEVHRLGQKTTKNGITYDAGKAYIVPSEQTQARMVRAVFETMTTFTDSLFYDVSTWTLPLAFDINYTGLEKGDYSNNLLGAKVEDTNFLRFNETPEQSNYAYLFEWDEYLAPKALYHIQKTGLRTKVATGSLQTNEGKFFDRGTILVPIQNQNLNASEIYEVVKEAAANSGVKIHPVKSGWTPNGLDLGSPNFSSLKKPNVCLLVAGGVSSYDAGEVWHLLDQRYDIPLTMLETDDVARRDLDKYNVLVMVGGGYGSISKGGAEKIKSWVQGGGTLIAIKDAVRWAKSNGMAGVDFKSSGGNNGKGQRPYSKHSADSGSNFIGGAIYETKMDLTHPLSYGYNDSTLPVFRRGTMSMKVAKNPYATPLIYTSNPLMSGYTSKKNQNLIKNSASIIVSGTGSGKVICMADNPNFRAFWYGTNKLFANAIFFGHIISGGTIERASSPATNGNGQRRADEHGHEH